MERRRVGILGATGMVGQRFVQRLACHPWFEITALAASESSAGRVYREACSWRISADMPESVREMTVQRCEPNLPCEIVFSALPASTARHVEEEFAASGYAVFSNASSHRMDPDVPILIPEVNADHLDVLPIQRANRGWDRGFIVTNPNCCTAILALALKPLHDRFGVRQALVTTMQALSGAGYPGVPSMDIMDNVIPYIAKEEEKLSNEPLKILGDWDVESGRFRPAEFTISASCNRVATLDGHLEAVSVSLQYSADLEGIITAFREFVALPQQLGCPTAPVPPIIVREEEDRPQTRLDRNAGQGMAVVVGRVRRCEVLDIKFTILGHNTIRGAAGASVLNAEIMIAREEI